MVAVPDLFSWQDKFIHALAYALMAFFFWSAAVGAISTHAKLALLTLLFCAIYGATDEWHQSFIAGRDASLFDWLADITGALLLTAALWKRERGLLERE
ncbi:VanZ like family protein [Mariprofundus ferrinatatus]|uniref:VanZ like family protein n=2 Tax=Mariprofundus ferrinatatus TaxID=1921087 RepID=A0A2K8L4M6_9PROT|nr:VanZ like family protein [Mariprofundus ferrinatatus]